MGKSEGELCRLLFPDQQGITFSTTVYTVPALPHRSEAELSFTARAPTAILGGGLHSCVSPRR